MTLGQGQDDIFSKILSRCSGRLMKHIKALESMLQSVHGRNNQELSSLPFAPGDSSTECSQDIESLGEYCEATHESYMHISKDRLKRLKELVSNVVVLKDTTRRHELRSLVKVAYDVRRSGSFKNLIGLNLVRPKNSRSAFPSVSAIVHRIGQISKFYRCAVTLTFAAAKILELGKAIKIQGIPARDIRVLELGSRTPTQVKRRGGHYFDSASENQMQMMIARWPRYRTHAEIQLIVFYEENPGIRLYSNYIGCNKQSCYLCYNFITRHGRFRVDGCHQSLYSLWTVPEAIIFADDQRATNFKHALGSIVADLEQKMRVFRTSSAQRRGFATHNESVPNLSRISLGLLKQTSMISLPPAAIASDNLDMVLEEVQMETSEGTVGDTMVEAGSKSPEIVLEMFPEVSQGHATEVLQQDVSEEPEGSPFVHTSPSISNDESSGEPSNEALPTPKSTSPNFSLQRYLEPPNPPSMKSESLLEPGAKGECAAEGGLEAKGELNIANATTEHPSIDLTQPRATLSTSSVDTAIGLIQAVPTNPFSQEPPKPYEPQPRPPHSHYYPHHRRLHHQQHPIPLSSLQPQRKSREKKRQHRNPTKNSSRCINPENHGSSTGQHRRKRRKVKTRDDEYGCTCGLSKMFSLALRELLRKVRAK